MKTMPRAERENWLPGWNTGSQACWVNRNTWCPRHWAGEENIDILGKSQLIRQEQFVKKKPPKLLFFFGFLWGGGG